MMALLISMRCGSGITLLRSAMTFPRCVRPCPCPCPLQVDDGGGSVPPIIASTVFVGAVVRSLALTRVPYPHYPPSPARSPAAIQAADTLQRRELPGATSRGRSALAY